MLIERKSPFSGRVNVMDIPVTMAQIEAWQRGMLIQRAMPHLTDGQREFMMTGITESEWDSMFAEEDE